MVSWHHPRRECTSRPTQGGSGARDGGAGHTQAEGGAGRTRAEGGAAAGAESAWDCSSRHHQDTRDFINAATIAERAKYHSCRSSRYSHGAAGNSKDSAQAQGRASFGSTASSTSTPPATEGCKDCTGCCIWFASLGWAVVEAVHHPLEGKEGKCGICTIALARPVICTVQADATIASTAATSSWRWIGGTRTIDAA